MAGLKVLIIGATGAIGTPITSQIVAAKSSFDKIAILTSRATVEGKKDVIQELEGEGVVVKVGDLGAEADVKTAYEGMYEMGRDSKEERLIMG